MTLAVLSAGATTDTKEISALVQQYVEKPSGSLDLQLEHALVGNRRAYALAQADVCSIAAALYAHGSPEQSVSDCVDAALKYCRAVEACAKAEASERVAVGTRRDASRLVATEQRISLRDENARLQERLSYGVQEYARIAKLEGEERTLAEQYGNTNARLVELRKLESIKNREMAVVAAEIAKNPVAKKQGLEVQLDGFFRELDTHDKEFEGIAQRQPKIIAAYRTATANSVGSLLREIGKDLVSLVHSTSESTNHPLVKDNAYEAAFSAWLSKCKPAVYTRWRSFSYDVLTAYNTLHELRGKQKDISEKRSRVRNGVSVLIQVSKKQQTLRDTISKSESYFTERLDWIERNSDQFSQAYNALITAAEEDESAVTVVKKLRHDLSNELRRLDDRIIMATRNGGDRQPPVQVFVGMPGTSGLNTVPATPADNLDQLPPGQKMSVIRGLLPQVSESVLSRGNRAEILMNISKPDSQARAVDAIRAAKIPVNASVIEQYSKRV